MVPLAPAPYRLPMTLNDVRSSIHAADSVLSGVHADGSGGGAVSELARAIHLLSDAVGELTNEVERLQGESK